MGVPSRAAQSRKEPSNGFFQVLVSFGYGSFCTKEFVLVGLFGKLGLPGQHWLARPALASLAILASQAQDGQPGTFGLPGKLGFPC